MTNQLYPAFFRLDRLQLLVVGAGAVGEEKLRFILKSSPNARVVVVAPWMGEELKALLDEYDKTARTQVQGELDEAGKVVGRGIESAATFSSSADRDPDAEQPAGEWFTSAGGSITWYAREFQPSDVLIADLVVAATDIRDVNHAAYTAAKANRRLCNIADTPSLCDFYLGSIVTRGPLKVAISTNGQSPTFAKRFRQFLEAELPQFETNNLLDNLKVFRDRLTGNFSAKVRQLNVVTSNLLAAADQAEKGCACPPGECLVAAAGSAVPASSTDSAPATAPTKDTDK